MRESIVLICPTPQARMPAADWHDGQLAHACMHDVHGGITIKQALEKARFSVCGA